MRAVSSLTCAVATVAALAAVALAPTPAAATGSATLTGTVTAPDFGPLSGIEVDVLMTTTTGEVSEAETDASGDYTINGITPGSYYLRFYPFSPSPAGSGYITTWYSSGGTGSLDASSAVAVGLGEGPNSVSMNMIEAGAISGKITDAVSGKAVQGMDVYAETPSNSLQAGNAAITGSDGTYTISNVPPESVIVRFQGLAEEFGGYYGGFTAGEAHHVSVLSNNTIEHVNGVLRPIAHVAGRVSAKSSGASLGSITVQLLDAAGHAIAVASPNGTTGDYTANIPSGTPLKAKFVDLDDSTYATQYWNNRPMLSCADLLKVAPNTTAGSVNAAMTTSASQIGSCGSSGPTSAQIKAKLKTELRPGGKKANVKDIAKSHGFAYVKFSALEAGSLVVSWAAKKVGVVAKGHVTYAGGGAKTLTVTLTTAGRKLFAHAGKLALTASGSFTPTGAGAVKEVVKFSLPRT